MAEKKEVKIKQNALHYIQKHLKAHKSQFNSFGKYNYRKAEDILEAVKPLLPDWFYLTLSDKIIAVADRIYVEATATLSDGIETYSTTAFAREENEKKGMDWAQVTGSSSSYARKYALNGLLAIDDTADPDQTNKHQKEDSKENVKKDAKVAKTDLTTVVIGKLEEAIKSGSYTKTLQECIDALTEKYIVSEEQKKIVEWLYTKGEEIVEEAK